MFGKIVGRQPTLDRGLLHCSQSRGGLATTGPSEDNQSSIGDYYRSATTPATMRASRWIRSEDNQSSIGDYYSAAISAIHASFASEDNQSSIGDYYACGA